MSDRPLVRADLAIVELDGEAVIYDERNGTLHHLNPTATLVLGLCDGSSTIPELATDLSDAFQVEFEDVRAQLDQLVSRMRDQGLLEPGAQAADETGDAGQVIGDEVVA